MHLRVDDLHGDRAEEVERQSTDAQPVGAARVPVDLDEMDEETERRSDVLLARVPRPGGVLRRPEPAGSEALEVRLQYSPLMTKYEPRIVPASLDFCLANLNLDSSSGTSMPSDSLNPTARLPPSASVYSTLIDSPLS